MYKNILARLDSCGQSGPVLWLTGLVPWGLAGWLWCRRAQVPWLATAAGVGMAGLLPMLGLIPFEFQNYSTVADHYMYLAMLGPACALAWGLAQSSSRVLTIGCVVVLGVLGLRSAWQTRYWQTTISLCEHALTVNPGSAVAHNNLGLALTAHNRLTEDVALWFPITRSTDRSMHSEHRKL